MKVVRLRGGGGGGPPPIGGGGGPTQLIPTKKNIEMLPFVAQKIIKIIMKEYSETRKAPRLPPIGGGGGGGGAPPGGGGGGGARDVKRKHYLSIEELQLKKTPSYSHEK